MLCRVTSAAVMRKPRNQHRIMRYAALGMGRGSRISTSTDRTRGGFDCRTYCSHQSQGAFDPPAGLQEIPTDHLPSTHQRGGTNHIALFCTEDRKPQRFQRTRDIRAFVGLCPKRDQSGETDKELPISKCGDRYLRRLLVSAAQYILGPFSGRKVPCATTGYDSPRRALPRPKSGR